MKTVSVLDTGDPEVKFVNTWSMAIPIHWRFSGIRSGFPPDFTDWRKESRTLSMAAYAWGSFNLADGDRPERVEGLRVSPNFFALLGVTPVRGRSSTSEEALARPGRSSHRSFWRNRFAADSTWWQTSA
jgi:hypothetical protein